MREKVYCKDCKYMGIIFGCYKRINENKFTGESDFLDYKKANLNGDCGYYEPKWFKQILRWFTRRRCAKVTPPSREED